ncbi:MAG: DNA helicase RecQ [Firmicutes bacterium]|nr:DNA helicase RecQ [Bacillota bacterium]
MNYQGDKERQAQAILQKVFGYASFRGGQAKVINHLLNFTYTLAIMPTGAGKSLCYQIPALLFAGITIVVSPLIALMKDQVDTLNRYGIPVTYINSSLKKREIKERLQEIAKGNYKVIYVAPERLAAEEFVQSLKHVKVDFIAVDEAHCTSQWGHDFRPSYRRIAAFIQNLPQRPLVGAFTATATPEIKSDIIKFLALKEPRVVVTGFDRQNLHYAVLRGQNKQEFVVDYVLANRGKAGIIYAATRNDVDKISELLNKNGILCSKYHAGMRDAERTENQENFLQGKLPVMVATNAFGMGIDKPDVRFVIHYSIPKNLESYYQEAGRAGRDGEPAHCLLLFHPQDVMVQKYLIEETVYSPRRKEHELKKLQMVVDYCHTSKCLRQTLLDYFGDEESRDYCGNCSNCLDDAINVDVTLDAQKALSCVYRLKGRFGSSMVAQVLKGARTKRIRQLKLDHLSTYGLMAEKELAEIRDFLGFLIAEGYLCLTKGKYPVVKLTKNAIDVLKGHKKITRKMPAPKSTRQT